MGNVKRYDSIKELQLFLSPTTTADTEKTTGKAQYAGKIFSNVKEQLKIKLQRIEHYIKTLFSNGPRQWINNNYVLEAASVKLHNLKKDLDTPDKLRANFKSDLEELQSLCGNLKNSVKEKTFFVFTNATRTALNKLTKEVGDLNEQFSSQKATIAELNTTRELLNKGKTVNPRESSQKSVEVGDVDEDAAAIEKRQSVKKLSKEIEKSREMGREEGFTNLAAFLAFIGKNELVDKKDFDLISTQIRGSEGHIRSDHTAKDIIKDFNQAYKFEDELPLKEDFANFVRKAIGEVRAPQSKAEPKPEAQPQMKEPQPKEEKSVYKPLYHKAKDKSDPFVTKLREEHARSQELEQTRQRKVEQEQEESSFAVPLSEQDKLYDFEEEVAPKPQNQPVAEPKAESALKQSPTSLSRYRTIQTGLRPIQTGLSIEGHEPVSQKGKKVQFKEPESQEKQSVLKKVVEGPGLKEIRQQEIAKRAAKKKQTAEKNVVTTEASKARGAKRSVTRDVVAETAGKEVVVSPKQMREKLQPFLEKWVEHYHSKMDIPTRIRLGVDLDVLSKENNDIKFFLSSKGIVDELLKLPIVTRKDKEVRSELVMAKDLMDEVQQRVERGDPLTSLLKEPELQQQIRALTAPERVIKDDEISQAVPKERVQQKIDNPEILSELIADDVESVLNQIFEEGSKKRKGSGREIAFRAFHSDIEKLRASTTFEEIRDSLNAIIEEIEEIYGDFVPPANVREKLNELTERVESYIETEKLPLGGNKVAGKTITETPLPKTFADQKKHLANLLNGIVNDFGNEAGLELIENDLVLLQSLDDNIRNIRNSNSYADIESEVDTAIRTMQNHYTAESGTLFEEVRSVPLKILDKFRQLRSELDQFEKVESNKKATSVVKERGRLPLSGDIVATEIENIISSIPDVVDTETLVKMTALIKDVRHSTSWEKIQQNSNKAINYIMRDLIRKAREKGDLAEIPEEVMTNIKKVNYMLRNPEKVSLPAELTEKEQSKLFQEAMASTFETFVSMHGPELKQKAYELMIEANVEFIYQFRDLVMFAEENELLEKSDQFMNLDPYDPFFSAERTYDQFIREVNAFVAKEGTSKLLEEEGEPGSLTPARQWDEQKEKVRASFPKNEDFYFNEAHRLLTDDALVQRANAKAGAAKKVGKEKEKTTISRQAKVEADRQQRNEGVRLLIAKTMEFVDRVFYPKLTADHHDDIDDIDELRDLVAKLDKSNPRFAQEADSIMKQLVGLINDLDIGVEEKHRIAWKRLITSYNNYVTKVSKSES